jgi:hypothetical protein
MATCAVIQDNVVVNIIVAEATDTPPDGTFLIEIPNCGIGYTWDGVRFTPPSTEENFIFTEEFLPGTEE